MITWKIRYALAIWAHHGMFAAGEDFDLTFGLMHSQQKSQQRFW